MKKIIDFIVSLFLWLPRAINARYEIFPQKKEDLGRASMLPEERPMLEQLQRAALSIEVDLEDRDECELYLYARNDDHSCLGGPYAFVKIEEYRDSASRTLVFTGLNKQQKPIECFCAKETIYQDCKIVQISWIHCEGAEPTLLWTIQKSFTSLSLDEIIPKSTPSSQPSTRPTEMINLFRAHAPTIFLNRE